MSFIPRKWPLDSLKVSQFVSLPDKLWKRLPARVPFEGYAQYGLFFPGTEGPSLDLEKIGLDQASLPALVSIEENEFFLADAQCHVATEPAFADACRARD